MVKIRAREGNKLNTKTIYHGTKKKNVEGDDIAGYKQQRTDPTRHRKNVAFMYFHSEDKLIKYIFFLPSKVNFFPIKRCGARTFLARINSSLLFTFRSSKRNVDS